MFNLPIPPMPLPGMGLTTPVALPVGTVVAFAGKIASFPSEAPSDYTTNIEALGWMVCDGRACKISEYPELFAVLGYLYGGNDGEFKIPSYQGQFLRGIDARTNKDPKDPGDPDTSSRTNPDPNKTDNNNGVGSRQEDALQIHQHQYTKVTQTGITQGDKDSAIVAAPPSDMLNGDPTDSLPLPPGNVRISNQETRPKNVYVYYIIKYTNG